MTNKLLKAEQVAEYLSIDPKEVFQLPLPRVQVTPNSIRYRPRDVDRYVSERLQRPGRPGGNGSGPHNRHGKKLRQGVSIQRLLLKKMLFAIQRGNQEKARLRLIAEPRPIELTEVVQEPLFSLGGLRASRRVSAS